MNWNYKTNQINALLSNLEITDNKSEVICNDKGFTHLRELLLNIRNRNNTVYAIGNGASASMASHFSADLAKNGKIHTQVFSDLALITAISNDLSYDKVFAEPLMRRGHEGDLLVAISSSGNSQNILNAVNTAKDLNMHILTLSAMSHENKLRRMGNINIYVPADTYGNAESCHAVILHHCIDQVLAT